MNERQANLGTPLNPFEQVEAVCAAFRQSWKQGRPQRIEDLLAAIDESGRANLFRNLLHIDIEARRRNKQQPTSDEYIQRFPQFARLIRQAFFESTMMSLAEFHNTPEESAVRLSTSGDGLPADRRTVSFALPAANRLGEYLLLHELGRGGFGIVYAARHVKRQEVVALKTLPLGDGRTAGQRDAERLHRFRREFRSLADINHPNLVGMQTLEVDGGQWFFTMDLVDGIDLLSYVRPNEELDEDRLRAVLPQLAGGIMALHARHIIHRDLKPSNVLVDAQGKVVILDFGLVAELETRGDHTQSLQSGQFAGTPLYAAPEQMFGQRSAASDWYALGVMLYQALSGERPFEGLVVEIMQQKQNQPAPRLLARDGIPEDLARLTDGLLERNPEVRPDALAIAKVLSVDVGQTPTTSYEEEPSTLTHGRDQPLIGRERQLAELEQAKRTLLATRQPLAMFVTGRSGEGKTSLAEAFLDPIRQQREMLILSGRCYDRESVPFKAVDSIIDALVGFFRGRRSEQVQTYIPDDISMLAHLFPVLRRVEAIAALPSSNLANLDGKQVRDRGFAALRQMLIRISQRFPLVLFIDDLQWGDADSAAVLHRLLSPPEAPAVLFLGTYRSDEAADSPFVQQWEKLCGTSDAALAQREVQVGPLSQPQCVAMVIARLEIDNASIRNQAAKLYQDTGGNPYFIEQLIECFDPASGSFTPAPLQEVIATRLQKLPAEATSLLQVVSVYGQAMSIDEAFLVIGQEKPSLATVTHMRSERLVRLLGSEDQRTVDTYHDKIRETVIDGLDEVKRREFHRRIGETIERIECLDVAAVVESVLGSGEGTLETLKLSRPNGLAYHFDMAGDRQKALVYSTLAAETAKAQFAHETAVDAFEVARRNVSPDNAHVQFRICAGLGESLVRLARHANAMSILENAAHLTEDPVEKAAMVALQAESEYRCASVTRSAFLFEQVLQDLGVQVPRKDRSATIAAGFEIINRFVVSRLLGPFRRKSVPNNRDKVVLKILGFLPYVYYWQGLSKCLWCCFASSNQGNRHRKGAFAVSSTEHCANGLMILGLADHAKPYYEKAIQCADEFNNLEAKANVFRLRGMQLLSVGRFTESLWSLEFPKDVYENRLPDPQRLAYTRYWMARGHFGLGYLLECSRLCSQEFTTAVHAGMDRMAAQVLETWTRAMNGRLPFEELATCFQFPEDPATQVQLLGGEVHWHLSGGRVDQAVEMAEKAFNQFKQHLPTLTQTSFIVAACARAHREHAEILFITNPQQARKSRHRALWFARWGLLRIQLMRCEHPALLREYAMTSAGLGRLRRAFKYARRSCAIAEQQGARYELAQSRLVVAELSKKLGLPDADKLICDAQLGLEEFQKMIEQAVSETIGPTTRTNVRLGESA